jgi:ABC-type thiamine transport system ATPase subunit
MRISKISVKNLFGIFNHVIPLNKADRITIIHGPNGFGKTILLNMINGFFSADYSVFGSVPLQEFAIEFESGDQVKVTPCKPSGRASKQPVNLNISLWRDDKQIEKYLVKPFIPDDYDFPIAQIDNIIPELNRVGPRTWRHTPTGEIYNLDQVVTNFGDILGLRKKEPKWLTHLRKSIQTRFLETQRLLSIARSAPYTRDQRERPVLPAVNKYSRELAAKLQSVLADYAKLSQELDSTFPARLVSQPRSAQLTKAELRKRLSELDNKRLRLVEAGLLDKAAMAIDVTRPQAIDERTKSVLSVYVSDVQKKFHVFDETAARLDLFKKVINQRFQYKSITIDRDAGFVFTNSNHVTLSPECLSSGEQHEIVLLYEMLFHFVPGTLFLIDEPELSLHVAWQAEFLSDTSEIAKLASFDVLIATHSPQIINNRWDLTVNLKGPAS